MQNISQNPIDVCIRLVQLGNAKWWLINKMLSHVLIRSPTAKLRYAPADYQLSAVCNANLCFFTHIQDGGSYTLLFLLGQHSTGPVFLEAAFLKCQSEKTLKNPYARQQHCIVSEGITLILNMFGKDPGLPNGLSYYCFVYLLA